MINSTPLILLLALPIGSFVGLLADRLPRGEAVVWGRSRCRHCGRSLTTRELLPLLSWLRQRGRCRCGRNAIGLSPLLAETGALALAAVSVAVLPAPLVWPGCLLAWLLLALALADAAHLLLPDVLTCAVALGGIAVALSGGPVTPAEAAAAGLIGGVGLCGVMAAYARLRGRAGLGLGDAKLLGAGATWTGLAPLPSVLLVAALGTLAGVLLARSGRLRATQMVPFGPGLAAGIWLAFLHRAAG
jgi:leader peptidase (prepilin peptidase)/N-methyltransferase